MEAEARAGRSGCNKRTAVMLLTIGVCSSLFIPMGVRRIHIYTAPPNGHSLVVSLSEENNCASELATCSSGDRTRWVALGCTREAVANVTMRIERNAYVDETHRVLYCFVPKVACTTFKAVMVASLRGVALAEILPPPGDNPMDKLSIIHRKGTLKKAGVQFFSSYTELQKEQVLKNYFKFLVVRHPFGRLQSAYKDKVKRIASEDDMFTVMRTYRQTITEYGVAHGLGPLYKDNSFIANFTQFLQLVAAGYEAGWMYNGHWEVLANTCDPCSIRYDHIVRLETVDQDAAPVLSRMPGPDGQPYQLPALNRAITPLKSMEDEMVALQKAYAEVDDVTIDRLMAIYRRDFELFGYTWDKQRRTPGCSFCRQSQTTYQTPPHCC